MWQAQQALEWGPMRSFWCYGSERFWNFCGHMIKDRAHPLANFINAFNLRRSVDEVPPAWTEEVISYATQHDIKHIKSAVEHMQGLFRPSQCMDCVPCICDQCRTRSRRPLSTRRFCASCYRSWIPVWHAMDTTFVRPLFVCV